jgi:hypothetical protein
MTKDPVAAALYDRVPEEFPQYCVVAALLGTTALRRRPRWTDDPIPVNAAVRPGDDFG